MTHSYHVGEKDTRPWGTWEVIAADEAYVVKKIVVNPGGVLSLQAHNFRSEHWIVASGTAEITLDDTVNQVPQNTHVFIDIKQKHRLANHEPEPLVVIEVQSGPKLDEGDTIRYEDIYGRATP